MAYLELEPSLENKSILRSPAKIIESTIGDKILKIVSKSVKEVFTQVDGDLALHLQIVSSHSQTLQNNKQTKTLQEQ